MRKEHIKQEHVNRKRKKDDARHTQSNNTEQKEHKEDQKQGRDTGISKTKAEW